MKLCLWLLAAAATVAAAPGTVEGIVSNSANRDAHQACSRHLAFDGPILGLVA